MKVNFLNKNVRNIYWKIFSAIAGILSVIFLFDILPQEYKVYLPYFGYLTFVVLIATYFFIWFRANKLTNISIDVDGSTVNIKCGDLFLEGGLKVIAFNEYFDTIVDNKIISKTSLNGVFINEYFQDNVADLDEIIRQESNDDDIISKGVLRQNGGNSIKYRLSTSIVYKDFVLTAFTKFDEQNRAVLTMPEYIEFLINFWDKINGIYAQRVVSVPIFGSGITRIKEHKNISDEELLKIMLWTFKLSEMKFKYPAKLTIVIHEAKINQVNLFDLKSIEIGL